MSSPQPILQHSSDLAAAAHAAHVTPFFDTSATDALLTQARKHSARSLYLGLAVLLVSLAALVIILFTTKRPEPAGNRLTPVDCCENDKAKILQCPACGGYDPLVYVALVVLVISSAGGVALLRTAARTAKRATDLEDDRLALRDARLAWELSRGLPDWMEKEPKSTTTEPNGRKITRGREYSFPRQRTQQQIVEGLMGRISK
ncbi:MAG: hypothetical protein ACK5V5_12780 [Cyclobacteriaceae bacterium]|jgi:hypothetical protein|nr:hypothetical protein [Flammeovirgaceae bacterium]